jgi:hypothetical protein
MSHRLLKLGYQLTPKGVSLAKQCRKIVAAVARGDKPYFLERVEQCPEAQTIFEEHDQETAITIVATLLDAKSRQTPKRGSWMDA